MGCYLGKCIHPNIANVLICGGVIEKLHSVSIFFNLQYSIGECCHRGHPPFTWKFHFSQGTVKVNKKKLTYNATFSYS